MNKKILIITFILFAVFFRFFRLDYPNAYVFDEVYHGFTAKEYLKGSIEAWEWWTTPPPGVAFEWTHPPLAKEFMTASMFVVRTTDAWGWRLPGAILGLISIFLVYKLGNLLFHNKNVGLIAAFIFSIDGLNFVQSRTGMNDIYLVTFSLASIFFLLKKRFIISSIFLGLALASKWAGLYLVGIDILLLIYFKEIRQIVYYTTIPILVYFLSYLPFFFLGHTFDQFIQLQQQMWWYHSRLKATHDYSSPAWSWPLNLFPVWYYVQYHKNTNVSNIFASGNPLLFWLGSSAVFVTIWDFITSHTTGKHHPIYSNDVRDNTNSSLWGLINTKKQSFLIILLGFFAFWLPWLFSPRIMFLYHFSPSIPFLCLALAYQLEQLFQQKNNRIFAIGILVLIFISFLLVYPFITGIPMPRNIMNLFFETNLTKNPFL